MKLGGKNTEFDYTRHFDEHGNVKVGDPGLTLNSLNASREANHTEYDSRTGDTKTANSDTTEQRTGDNTIHQEDNGLDTITDANGNVTTILDDHFTNDYNVGGDWGGPQANPFQIPNPAAAGLLPNAFFSQGILPNGGSLFGSGFGTSSDRPPRTNLPPIATGTEPDGTYWERYDNGTIWIYREYEREGGKLTREEWGRHVISLPDVLAEYKVFLDQRAQETDKFTDMVFTDPKALMDALNQRENTPSKQEKLNSLRRRIKIIKEMLLSGHLRDDVHLHYKDRLNELVEEYVRLGGDLSKLGINKVGEGGIASDIEKQAALVEKLEEALITLKMHELEKDKIRKEMQDILDNLPLEAFIVTTVVINRVGTTADFRRYNENHPDVKRYRELQRKLEKSLEGEEPNYIALRKELYQTWVDTLSVADRNRHKNGFLKTPAEFDLPLSENEQERKYRTCCISTCDRSH